MLYRLTQAAQEDIIIISDNGIKQFGVTQARLYHDALFKVFELLAENPKMARERADISPSLRVHPYQSHVILYQIEGDNILIIRVRHGREDWMISV